MHAALKPSQMMNTVLIVSHGLATLAILYAKLTIGLLGYALAAIAASLWFNLCSALVKTPWAPQMLAVAEDGTLNLQNRNGNCSGWTVIGRKYESDVLTVINLLSIDGGLTREVTTFPGITTNEAFRQLRI